MNIKLLIRQWVKMAMQNIALPLVYRFNCLRYHTIDKKMVIFADAHHTAFPRDMKLVRAEMERRGYHVVDCVSNYASDGIAANTKNMMQFMKLYAQAHYVFLCDYFLPVIAGKKRKDTKVIQLWHACGAYKRFGYDAPDDLPPFMKKNAFGNFDLVSVSAKSCAAKFAGAFGLPEERVLPLGVSRTDLYYDENYMEQCREEFYAQYPEARHKRIALWAPTFRSNAGTPVIAGEQDIIQLQEKLGDEWFIIRRLHPHAENKASKSNCTIVTERLFAVTDILITDYSSVIFDYALTRKPIVLYTPDKKAYEGERGFYLKFEELPGRRALDEKELEKIFMEEDFGTCDEHYEQFVQNYLAVCDGKSTERIVSYVENM